MRWGHTSTIGSPDQGKVSPRLEPEDTPPPKPRGGSSAGARQRGARPPQVQRPRRSGPQTACDLLPGHPRWTSIRPWPCCHTVHDGATTVHGERAHGLLVPQTSLSVLLPHACAGVCPSQRGLPNDPTGPPRAPAPTQPGGSGVCRAAHLPSCWTVSASAPQTPRQRREFRVRPVPPPRAEADPSTQGTGGRGPGLQGHATCHPPVLPLTCFPRPLRVGSRGPVVTSVARWEVTDPARYDLSWLCQRRGGRQGTQAPCVLCTRPSPSRATRGCTAGPQKCQQPVGGPWASHSDQLCGAIVAARRPLQCKREAPPVGAGVDGTWARTGHGRGWDMGVDVEVDTGADGDAHPSLDTLLGKGPRAWRCPSEAAAGWLTPAYRPRVQAR